MKKHRWTIVYSICLLAFTVYITLDTFVISRAWNVDATKMNTSMFDKSKDLTDSSTSQDDTSATKDISSDRDGLSSGRKHGESHGRRKPDHENDSGESNSESDENSSGTVTMTENSTEEKNWKNDNINITVKEYKANDTIVYVADVSLSSAEYLNTAFAKDTYGKNVTQQTSVMAEANHAILAINGDNYGSQEKGYVIRNGVVYRDEAGDSDVLCIYADGSMQVIDPSEFTANELVEKGVWQAFSFGPALIENSEIAVSKNQEVGKAKASNPRTAIGLIDNLHYVLVVADGRTDESKGLSLHELADFMKKLGVKTAYNLDGGGSSTMVFNGEVINKPTTTGDTIKERKVNDIVYIG